MQAPVPLCALTRHGHHMLTQFLGLTDAQYRKGNSAWQKDPQSGYWQRLEDGLEDDSAYTPEPKFRMKAKRREFQKAGHPL